jgi:hypothetical protein
VTCISGAREEDLHKENRAMARFVEKDLPRKCVLTVKGELKSSA